MGVNTYRGRRIIAVTEWEMFMSTVDWAEQNIRLTSQTSAYAGDFSFDITPHMRTMCNDFDKPSTVEIFMKCSTQVSKTTFLFIVGIKTLVTTGGQAQLAIPNDNMLRDYTELKINPFIDSVPIYKKAIADKAKIDRKPTKDDLKITAISKWSITGNTPLARNSRSVQILLMDEIRLFKGESDISEFKNRTKSFSKQGRKIIGVSSWEHKDDPIDSEYKKCELKKEWSLRCRKCKELFYPMSSHFNYYKKDMYLAEFKKDENTYKMLEHLRVAKSRKSFIQCPFCKNEIDSYERDQMLLDADCDFRIVEGRENSPSIGYLVNALGTYFTPLSELTELLIKADDSFQVLSRIYRDYFNELYSQQVTAIEAVHILELDSGLDEFVIPDDTYKIFLGVDNQKDHLYWILSAVTYDNNQYTVAHGKAMSNEVDDDFRFVKHLFNRSFKSLTRYHHVSALALDVRGYKQDGIDRIADAKSFLVELQEEIDANGITDQEVFGVLGVDKLFEDRHYRVSNRKEILDDEMEVKYKTLVMSNTAIKDDLSYIISRSISKARAKTEDDKGYNYQRKLFYINATIVQNEMEYFNNNNGELLMKHYAMHMTSESKDLADGGVWKKDRVRNDWLDCHCMIHTLNLYFNVEYETKQYKSHN